MGTSTEMAVVAFVRSTQLDRGQFDRALYPLELIWMGKVMLALVGGRFT